MTPSLTFTRWLSTHMSARTPIGDLARDMDWDSAWPLDDERQSPTLYAYRTHMVSVGACDGALAALESAWQVWRSQARGI